MTTSLHLASPPELSVLRRTRRRRPVLFAVNAAALLLCAMAITTLVTNPRFEWATVGSYLFDRRVLAGVGVTVAMTAVTMALSLVLGTGVALVRMSPARLLALLSGGFIWVFRSIPLLVQLLCWYNLAALFPTLSLGVPWGARLVTWDSNVLIAPLTAAFIGLTLHETAYTAELVRAGLLSLPPGQKEAAAALGMTPVQAFRRITAPQALRVIVPPLGNQVITLLKATSLVSVIALADVLYSVQLIYAENYRTVPLLFVAAVWYMAITGMLTLAQSRLERRLARGHRVPGTKETETS